MKKLTTLGIIILFTIILLGCEEEEPIKDQITYNNPVFEPVLADPSVIFHDGVYYAYGTQDYGQWGDDYGVKYGPILSSTNLSNISSYFS